MADNTEDERRKIRSDQREIAVELQLSHVAHVLDLQALVLADDFGRQIAAVGDPNVGEVLSALAMWVEFNGGTVDEYTSDVLHDRDPGFEEHHVLTHPVRVPGANAPLQLIALGRSIVTAIGVSHAARGIERIHRSAPN